MENKRIIEALIFANDGPLDIARIKSVLDDINSKTVKKIITEINKGYEDSGSPFEIIEVAGGYQIVTREIYSNWIVRLNKARQAGRMTQKALETLAIIAYKQPITKAEMESIRGVNVDGVVRTLIERNLINITGREKAPGNPLLYGTTKFFLESFGLKNLSDLPKLKEIDELLQSDDKFLESLDQVSLQQLKPEELGLKNMNEKQAAAPEQTSLVDAAEEKKSEKSD
jgi:segregation and condensation protein B